MQTTFVTTLVLGLALGVKHAFDADHVVAVSTIVSQYRSPFRAALVGAFWGIGHTATLLLVGIAVIGFKFAIPDRLALAMEFTVGAVLFGLGVQILWQWRPLKKHTHLHDHGSGPHTHEHSHAAEAGGPAPSCGSLVPVARDAPRPGGQRGWCLCSVPSPSPGLAYILVQGRLHPGDDGINTLIGLPFALSSRGLHPQPHHPPAGGGAEPRPGPAGDGADRVHEGSIPRGVGGCDPAANLAEGFVLGGRESRAERALIH
jgi:hypothetical protein